MRRRTQHRWGLTGLLLLVLAAGAVASETTADPFLSDIDSAFAEARRSERLLLIYFRADWCAPCREMKRTTWRDDSVLEWTESFVALRVDGDARQDLVLRYGLEFYPGLVITDPDGLPLLVVNGYQDASQTIGHLRAALEHREELESWATRSHHPGGDGDGLVLLAEFARERQAMEHAERLYRRAIRGVRPTTGKMQQRARLGLAALLVGAQRCEDAMKVLGTPEMSEPLSEALSRARHATLTRLRGCRELGD